MSIVLKDGQTEVASDEEIFKRMDSMMFMMISNARQICKVTNDAELINVVIGCLMTYLRRRYKDIELQQQFDNVQTIFDRLRGLEKKETIQ